MHTGIYYRPGSLKAQNCRAGKMAMEEFCTRENIPFDLCGKIIVAVEESELPRMETLLERGPRTASSATGSARSKFASSSRTAPASPAIHVPEAGVVDYGQVAERLADDRQRAGQPRRHDRAGHRHPPRQRPRDRRNHGRRIRRPASRQLRRPLQRPRHAAQRREAVGDDRAVPRRVLRAAARRRSTW